jgi:hypothetical protein
MQALLNEQEWEEYKRLKEAVKAVKCGNIDKLAREAVMNSIMVIRSVVLSPMYTNATDSDRVFKVYQPLLDEVRKIQDALKVSGVLK